jgi:hypothetical protein
MHLTIQRKSMLWQEQGRINKLSLYTQPLVLRTKMPITWQRKRGRNTICSQIFRHILQNLQHPRFKKITQSFQNVLTHFKRVLRNSSLPPSKHRLLSSCILVNWSSKDDMNTSDHKEERVYIPNLPTTRATKCFSQMLEGRACAAADRSWWR